MPEKSGAFDAAATDAVMRHMTASRANFDISYSIFEVTEKTPVPCARKRSGGGSGVDAFLIIVSATWLDISDFQSAAAIPGNHHVAPCFVRMKIKINCGLDAAV